MDKFLLYGIAQKKHFENDIAGLFDILGKKTFYFEKKKLLLNEYYVTNREIKIIKYLNEIIKPV